MKKKRKGLISFAFILIMSVLFAVNVFAASGDDYASMQIAVTGPDTPSPENASIIFSAQPKMDKMTYLGSEEEGRYSELYSEKIEWNGVQARQVYVENYFYFKLDESFAGKDDSVFEIILDYWDYGGGGYFYVEYMPRGASEVKSERVYKLGLDENNVKTQGTWFRVRIHIDDAEFTGKFDNGADIRIRSGAYNSFSKVEVRNISRSAAPDEKLGTFNRQKANSLHTLEVFDGFGEGEEFDPCLDKELTREEALTQLIKSYRMEDKALSENMKSGFSDVSPVAEPYVAMAVQLGVVEKGSVLGAKDYFSQKELITWYLKLIGENVTGETDVYALAKDKKLINVGSMIFQPEKNADVDAFVHLAMNSFSMTNPETGYCPFSEGISSGDYNMQTLAKANDENIWDWLMSSEFKVPKKTCVDKYTGRTYYTVNFFGQYAIKPYFTMNCMSMDETRIYFNTSEYKCWEYNIETEMCRYIEHCASENDFMITPLNNLWYINKKYEIWKLDLDTPYPYEKTYIGKLPEWQRSSPSLLQVNNDESKLSVWWNDNKGDIDNKLVTRLPVFDIKTGEWDLSHYYGFDFPVYAPNHPCLNPNPEYDHLYFFAHETLSDTLAYFYEGSLNPERVWVVNMDTDEYYNAVEQKWFRSPDSKKPGSGYVGENAGHEFWSYDGEWIGKVGGSTYVDGMRGFVGPDTNFLIQRPDGTDKRYIKADYGIAPTVLGSAGTGTNHSMISHDGRWIAADNKYGSSAKLSGLFVIDAETGATSTVAFVPQNGANPGHLHPQMSPKNTYAIFGCWDETFKIAQFGWADVSDITSKPAPGGRYDISETCDAIDYDGNFAFDVKPLYKMGGTYEGTKVPAGKELYVNVKREVADDDNVAAEITITYKDDTTLPITLNYHRWVVNSHKYVNMVTDDKIYIERKGTGKIVSKTLKFDDICLGNMDVLGTDFRIGAAGTDATIISVDVKPTSASGKDENK